MQQSIDIFDWAHSSKSATAACVGQMMGQMVRQTDGCLAVAQTPSFAYYVGTANSISYFLFREISWL